MSATLDLDGIEETCRTGLPVDSETALRLVAALRVCHQHLDDLVTQNGRLLEEAVEVRRERRRLAEVRKALGVH